MKERIRPQQVLEFNKVMLEITAKLDHADKLNTSLDLFELSCRTKNVLEKENIITFGDLVKYTEKHMLHRFKNCGHVTVNELKVILSAVGLSFAE